MAVGDLVLKEEVVGILGVFYLWGIAWCGGKWRDLFRSSWLALPNWDRTKGSKGIWNGVDNGIEEGGLKYLWLLNEVFFGCLRAGSLGWSISHCS